MSIHSSLESEITLLQRSGALDRAQQMGYGQSQMIETHIAIATLVARTFALAAERSATLDKSRYSNHVLPMLTYEGQPANAGVLAALAAIMDLPETDRHGLLIAIADLVGLHAPYTHSHPDTFDARGWTNELTGIANDIRLGLDRLRHPATHSAGICALGKTLRRLGAVFGSLWS